MGMQNPEDTMSLAAKSLQQIPWYHSKFLSIHFIHSLHPAGVCSSIDTQPIPHLLTQSFLCLLTQTRRPINLTSQKRRIIRTKHQRPVLIFGNIFARRVPRLRLALMVHGHLNDRKIYHIRPSMQTIDPAFASKGTSIDSASDGTSLRVSHLCEPGI